MTRQQAAKHIDQFGRVPEPLKQELINFLVELDASHKDAMGAGFSDTAEINIADLARRFGTRLKLGGESAREILQRPKAKVLPWKETK